MGGGNTHKFLTVARKAGVAALAVIAVGVSYSAFPDPWDTVANAVLAVAAYYGVYYTKNVPIRNESPKV